MYTALKVSVLHTTRLQQHATIPLPSLQISLQATTHIIFFSIERQSCVKHTVAMHQQRELPIKVTGPNMDSSGSLVWYMNIYVRWHQPMPAPTGRSAMPPLKNGTSEIPSSARPIGCGRSKLWSIQRLGGSVSTVCTQTQWYGNQPDTKGYAWVPWVKCCA